MSEAMPVINFHMPKLNELGNKYIEIIESLINQVFDDLGAEKMKFNIYYSDGILMKWKEEEEGANKEIIMDILNLIKHNYNIYG